MGTKMAVSIVWVFLAVAVLPMTVLARLPVEQMQREFQGRYYFINGQYVIWPGCPCGSPAPNFPQDDFYGDLDKNPCLAVQLVQDLASKFYGTALYASFLNTSDGVTGIAGQSSPPNNYLLADFPSVVGSADMTDSSSITTNNYASCFATLKSYIKKLNYVGGNAGVACVDTNCNDTAGSGRCYSYIGSDAALQKALTYYTNNGWTGLESGIYVTAIGSTGYDIFGNQIWLADLITKRGRVFVDVTNLFPRLVSGELNVYLQVQSWHEGIGANTPPLTADDLYHLFATTTANNTQEYYSDPQADYQPIITSFFTDYNWPDAAQGWYVAGEFFVLAPIFNTNPDKPTCGGGGCTTCQGGGGPPGSTTAATGSLDVKISLGPDNYGKSAGYFYLHADAPSGALYTASYLNYSVAPDVTVAFDGSGAVGQVTTPNVTAYVQTNIYGYAILFTNQNLDPPEFVSSVTVSNNSGNTNQMIVAETIGSGGTPRIIQFNYTAASNNWTMVEGGGLRNESRTTVWTTPTNRTDTILVQNSSGAVATQTSENYQLFPWGLTLVQQTLGIGSSAKATTWTYYQASDGDNNYGQIKQMVGPYGHWERYQYDSAGRLTNTASQFGDNDISTADSANRATKVVYDDASGIITTIVLLLGTEVSRTYEAHSVDDDGIEQIQTFQCTVPGAAISNPSNLTNIVWRTTDSSLTGNAWDTLQELNPDGTMSFYSYSYSGDGTQKTVVIKNGTPNSGQTDIVDGTQTTTVSGQSGQVLTNQVQDILSGLVVDQKNYNYTDNLNRSYIMTQLDGTSNVVEYACCGLDQTTDPDGVVTLYSYDAAKRSVGYENIYGSTVITYTNTLDAAGRTLQSIRMGSDSSSITLNKSAYDTAGALIQQTNALGGVTAYTRTTNSSTGGLILTTIYPNGGGITNYYYGDGSLKKTIGSAVHGKAYGYGAGTDVNSHACTFITETNLNASGSLSSEWTKTFTDMARRTTEVLYADSSYSQSFYNGQGQLWKQVDPDGVATLYQYNGKGEQSVAAVDMDRNGTIDFSGTDRITSTVNDVTTDHGVTVRRSRTYIFAASGSSTSNLVSVVESSVDGTKSWQTQYRDASVSVTNSSQTSPGTARTVITIAPDNSYTISIYSYGRLASTTRFDSTSAEIGATSYGYDAHGRRNTMTDVRNGTTTFGFNNADLVTSVTTPNPGGGSPEVTATSYNNMMQATTVTQPDGTSVSSLYLLTGELGQQSGSRTYPVGYSYDYAGRMKTMTNWSSFPATGARVTTWNYSGDRGFLTGKTYDGGVAGPSYTYTAANRLLTRTWARGITTTYAYDNAGGLATVLYSDATPGVTNNYDRLGRLSSVFCNGTTDTLTNNLANELLGESFFGGVLNGLAITNQYDQFMRRTNLASLSGASTLARAIYTYDAASRLASVSDGTNNAAYTYLANSPLVSQIAFKQGGAARMTTTKQYDYLNRLTAIASAPSASSAVNFNYNYNAANQRTKNVLADGSYWVYTYDSLGQVTGGNKFWADGTAVAGQQFDYAFDNIGNRTQTQTGGDQTGANLRTANYYANNLNQLTNRDVPAYADIKGVSIATNTVSVNGQSAYRKGEYFRKELNLVNGSSALWSNIVVNATGQTSITGSVYLAKSPEIFRYDADGNLTNDGRFAYVWDGEDRLIQMTVNTNVGPQYTLTFAYDYQGRRIQKLVSTNGVGIYTNRFVYDGWNLVAELNPNSSLIRSYLWGSDLSGSMQGAGGVGGLLAVSYYGSTTTNCFPAFDGNGNVAGLVNAADGTTVANYEYGPFGEPIRITGAMANNSPFLFSTKYYDSESGDYYYGYRFYNPRTGTWPNKDPMGEEGGINVYGFVDNNPINEIDIFGLLDYKLEVTVGSVGLSYIYGAEGKWGQPSWSANGDYAIVGDSAFSTVTITSRNKPGGACNSVDQPDPAGTIKLYLRNDCPGDFQVSIFSIVQLTGTGPRGAATGKLEAGGKLFINGFGSTTSRFMKSDNYNFTAYVNKKWTVVAVYTPTVSLGMDKGVTSTGTAYGFMQFISATKK